MLVQVVSGAGLLVCYKAKDLLRTALQHYRSQISWKQGKAPTRTGLTYHNHTQLGNKAGVDVAVPHISA